MGPPPKDVGEELEKQALEKRLDKDGKIEDDVLDDVDISDPGSFVTFARYRNVGLLTHKSVSEIVRKNNNQDPVTRQPLHPDVIAFGKQRSNSLNARSSPRGSSSRSSGVTNARSSSSSSARSSSSSSVASATYLLNYGIPRWAALYSNSNDIRANLGIFVNNPARNLEDRRLSNVNWGNTNFIEYIKNDIKSIHDMLVDQEYDVPPDCTLYDLHILPYYDFVPLDEQLVIRFACKLNRDSQPKWYVVTFQTDEPLQVRELPITDYNQQPSQSTRSTLLSIVQRDLPRFMGAPFPVVRYEEPVLFSSFYLPPPSGGASALHKTSQKVSIRNHTHVVYINERGTKFVELNKRYMYLSKVYP